jgi:hypothetical protein
MPNSATITLANGDRAVISGASAGADGSISYQLLDPAGQAIGSSHVLAQGHGLGSTGFFNAFGIDTQTFAATPLSTGGFEVVFNAGLGDPQGFVRNALVGVGVDANGVIADQHLFDPSAGFGPDNIFVDLNAPGPTKIPFGTPITPHVSELDGGRFAVTYETFDVNGGPVAHVGLGTVNGLYADTEVASPPDDIVHTNGDIALIWNQSGSTLREVLAEDGTVLSARGVTHIFTASTGAVAVLNGFDPAHDQLDVVNADATQAGGPTSTLTFDARDRSLTWDQDSAGPIQAVRLGTLDVEQIGVANLEDGFRPEVLKVIAADGSQKIEWFDSDHSQPWDTLFATLDPAGNVTTYASTLDDGTRTVFTFDIGNLQPYQRYVDQDDAAGHVLQRTVLYDDNTSWTATFKLDRAGQVVSYELDSFDAAGHQVGQSFFNADGTPLVH